MQHKSFTTDKFVALTALVVILVAVAVLTYIFLWGSGCGKITFDRNLEEMNRLLDRFSNAETIAARTSRIALSAPVQNLSSIREEASALDVVDCLLEAKTLMIGSFDRVIMAYLAFMSNEDDETVSLYYQFAADELRKYAAQIEKVKQCAPFCTNK